MREKSENNEKLNSALRLVVYRALSIIFIYVQVCLVAQYNAPPIGHRRKLVLKMSKKYCGAGILGHTALVCVFGGLS
jgi:hypothetical protein